MALKVTTHIVDNATQGGERKLMRNLKRRIIMVIILKEVQHAKLVQNLMTAIAKFQVLFDEYYLSQYQLITLARSFLAYQIKPRTLTR